MADLFHDDDELVEVEEDLATVAETSAIGRRHRAAPGPRDAGRRARTASPAIIEPADTDLRAEVYGKLLAGLGLTDAHRHDSPSDGG